MLGFYFAFAIAATYPLCISGTINVNCFWRQYTECDQSLVPTQFPATLDQLRDYCRGKEEYETCALKIFEGCKEDDENIDEFRDLLDYIHEHCKEESEVFQVISSNLQCLASNVHNIYESCNSLSFSETTKELIQNVRQHANISQDDIHGSNYWCLENLWNAYCPSTLAGIRCGFDVGTAVKDILLHTSGFSDPEICPEEFVAGVTPMLERIELAIVQEENLKKMEEEEEDSRRKRRYALFF